MSIADYKGVWVFAEQREGELQKVSLELLGEGRKIADKLGVNLTALLLGDNVKGLADTLGRHGADEVLVAESSLLKHYTTDGYTKVICDLANERKPGIIFIGATFIGRDLGPRLSARVLCFSTNLFISSFTWSIESPVQCAISCIVRLNRRERSFGFGQGFISSNIRKTSPIFACGSEITKVLNLRFWS